jgi:hypothetical protein
VLTSWGLVALFVEAVALGLMFIRGGGLFSAVRPNCVKGFSFGVEAEDGVTFAAGGSAGVEGVLEDGDAAEAGVLGRLPFPLPAPSFARRFARIWFRCQYVMYVDLSKTNFVGVRLRRSLWLLLLLLLGLLLGGRFLISHI